MLYRDKHLLGGPWPSQNALNMHGKKKNIIFSDCSDAKAQLHMTVGLNPHPSVFMESRLVAVFTFTTPQASLAVSRMFNITTRQLFEQPQAIDSAPDPLMKQHQN